MTPIFTPTFESLFQKFAVSYLGLPVLKVKVDAFKRDFLLNQRRKQSAEQENEIFSSYAGYKTSYKIPGKISTSKLYSIPKSRSVLHTDTKLTQ